MHRRSFLLSLPLLACTGSSTSPSTPPSPSSPPPAEPDASGAPDAPAEPTALAKSVDELFAAAASKDRFSGSVVVVDGGEVVLDEAYGLADRDAKRANVASGIYRLGSVTKQFTASAILALAEDGLLAVDDPASKFFPEYPKENLSKDGVDVTLHHLLSHTSGIGDARTTQWFKDRAWWSVIDPKEYLAVGAELPMKRKPGTKFEYSNWAFYLLGLVVERVSGKSYADFMTTRFFAPLGMNDTRVVLSSLEKEQASRVPHGYADQDGDGELATLDAVKKFVDRDCTFAFGSGQILSTTADLVKWDRALGARKVLPKLGDRLFQDVMDAYGYGWVVETRNGTPVQWHDGALSPLGFTSLVVRVPSKDRFVAYLANMDLPIVAPLAEKVLTLAVS